MLSAAQVTVQRSSPDDIRQRQLVVSLDGAPFATLLFGGCVTRAVPPGRHRLRIHNTLVWRTIDVELHPGEHLRLEAVNRAGPGTMALIGLLGVGPLYITVRRLENPDAGTS